MKETKYDNFINTLRACTWDLIFMSLLELKATHNFGSPRSYICIMIAVSIIIITIILLLN